MNFYREEFGLPERFGSGGQHQLWVASDGIGWRESKCQNDVTSSTGCCVGYWQLYVNLYLKDYQMKPHMVLCDVDEKNDVLGLDAYDKQRNACVAKALFDVVGYSPWHPT